MPQEIDHDQLFKQLLNTFFLDFLDLFAPQFSQYVNRDSIEFLPQEYFTDLLEGDRRVLDLIVKVDLIGRMNAPESSRVSVIINLEHQSSSEADFNRRFFFYFSQIHREYLQPVFPIVIFSFDSPQRREKNQYEVTVPGFPVLNFNFLAIQLNQLNWRDFLGRENPVAAALMSKMKIAVADRPKVKVECLRAIANLRLDPVKTFLLSGFVDNYLRLTPPEEVQFRSEIDLLPLSIEKEQIMEITTSWMERGIEQGMERGKIEGEQSLVIKQLARKLGNISDELLTQINCLDLESVESLGEALLSFQKLEDLTTWLTEND
jgi:hypothetical protein